MKKLFQFVVLFLVPLTFVVNCGKGCQKPQGGSSQEGEISAYELISDKDNLFMGFNWPATKKSPLGTELEKQVPDEAKYFLDQIDNMIMAAKTADMKQQNREIIMIISGELNEEELINKIKEEKKKKQEPALTNETYEGVTLHLDKTEKSGEFAYAFVQGKLILGSKNKVKESIDLSKGKGQSLQSQAALVKTIDQEQGKMFWLVAQNLENLAPESSSAPTRQQNPFEGAIKEVKSVLLSGDYVETRLDLNLDMISSSPEKAKELLETVQAFKTIMGAAAAQQDPEMGQILNSLKSEQKGDKVEFRVSLSQEQLDKIGETIKEQQMRQMKHSTPQKPAAPETEMDDD